MVAFNSNYSNFDFSQAQNLLSQIQSCGDTDYTSGSANYWFNSAFTELSNILQNNSGNTKDAVPNIIQSLTQKLGDMLSGLGDKESQKADSTAKKNDEKIKDNNNKIEQTKETLDARLEEIMNKCTANGDAIKEALTKIIELGGADGSKAQQDMQELQAQLDKIEENKAILNNEEADPEERKKALGEILGAASAINSLVAKLGEYDSVIQEQNKIVEKNKSELDSNYEQANSAISDAQTKLQEFTQQNAQLGQEQIQQAADGAGHQLTGKAKEAMAQAMQTGPQAAVTAPEAQKLQISGQDDMQAGKTLMTNASDGLKGVEISNENVVLIGQKLSEYQQGLGQYYNGAKNMVGQYESTVQSMISSIGSWEELNASNQELQDYVKDYNQQIQTLNGNAVTSTPDASSTPAQPYTEAQPASQTPVEQQDIQTPLEPKASENPAQQTGYTTPAEETNENDDNNPFKEADSKDLQFVKFEFETSKFNIKKSS